MISGTVTNNTKLPAKGTYSSALHKTIAALTMKLLGMVKSDKLSGQVLNRKTGRLSRSINAKFENGGSTGVVGTNVAYGKVHENGGAYSIPAHMRMMKVAFGKPVQNPRMIEVREHIARFPERSFLRTALRELEPEIQPALNKAIKETISL